MFEFNTDDYGKTAAALLALPRSNALGPGKPNGAAKSMLRAMTDESLLMPHRVSDKQMSAGGRSGLWLLHDFLDESHRIAQDIHTPTGSFWHGIMHRREPDPSNAKYWFRKVGDHPVFQSLREESAELALRNRRKQGWDDAAGFLVEQSQWDPFAWIDLCEAARTGRVTCKKLCGDIQIVEWQLLFDFCYQRASAD